MSEDKKLSEKIRNVVIPSGPKGVCEPEKEIRFTRAAQASLFFAVSVLVFAACVAVFILSTQDWGMDRPILDGWLWLCIPGLLLIYAALRTGLRCTRHAYIILNPLGIEIFPFYRPEKNLQIIYWSQLDDADFSKNARSMTLHFNAEKSSGVVVSLNPIPCGRRHLLEEAVLGVLEKRQEAAVEPKK